jgi:hypothetical protein
LIVTTAILTLTATTACRENPIGASPGPAGATGAATQDSDRADDQLDLLKVGKAGSMKGYSREKFPHWRSTGENCDVRDSVLARDGRSVKRSGCNVVAGTWTSIYDGQVLNSPTKVDIDHMVPLANAWRSGASSWTTDRRGDFANDLDDPQLVAVSASSNRSKGDQDPSTWKPADTGEWCHYAQDWIEVKTAWKLSVTTTEKSALAAMLRTC